MIEIIEQYANDLIDWWIDFNDVSNLVAFVYA